MKNYGMFTDAGNELVENLVLLAKVYSISPNTVLAMMDNIAKDECFGEITDTAVREMIGDELGWYK